MYYNKSQPTLWVMVFLTLILTQFPTLVQCQGADYPSFEAISKGRIFTTEGFEIKASDISFSKEKYHYISSNSSVVQDMNFDEVIKVEKRVGSKAGKWAAIMGLEGLTGSLVGVLQSERDYPGAAESSDIIVPLVVGITGVSALVGLLIGNSRKKYKEVYANPAYRTQSSPIH